MYYSMNAEQREDLPALILLHGAGGNGAQWPYQIRRLPGYRVFALDLPGHGGSTLTAERSVAGFAARIWEWADSVGVATATLCGHSMGAAIAMEMALAQPERAAYLLLLGAAGRLDVNSQLLEKFAVPIRVQEGVNMLARWSFSKDAPESLRKAYVRQLLACPPGLLLNDFKACANFELGELAAQLRMRAAVVGAAEDVMVSPRLSAALAEALPRATFHSLPAAGHMLMIEKPQATTKLVEAILGRWKAD